MKPTIVVNHLAKLYRIGSGSDAAYATFRETVTDTVLACGRRLSRVFRNGSAPQTGPGGNDPAAARSIWALEDVSFAVQPGEVLGIIGRNGAGKSTLLKILSRITAPTRGQVEMRGRVGSLLEVGTGFHPELTGRENIFLNGAILGMTRQEIARKFDAIVSFAEIERWVDTPVKRYSSGMYMRLAFAVASHLEPEVLIVDEVLAVGDAAFQKKCLGKMDQVSRQGRTVLFVSHNLAAVKSLCSRAILIEGGRLACDGGVDEVVNRYLTASAGTAATGRIPATAVHQRDVPDEACFHSVRLTDRGGRDTDQLFFGQPFRVGFRCEVLQDLPDALFEVSISTLEGTQVTMSTTLDGGNPPLRLTRGWHEVWVDFDVVLMPRQYTIDVGIHHEDGTTADLVERTLDFTVLRVAANGNDHYRWSRTRGLVRTPVSWNLELTRDSVPLVAPETPATWEVTR